MLSGIYSSFEFEDAFVFMLLFFIYKCITMLLRDLSVDFDLSSGKEFTHDFIACMYLTN